MTETYDEFPGIEVHTPEEMISPGPSGHRFVHIDDFESHDQPGVELHLYTFESEDRRDELIELSNELKQEYIATTCIIWPDEIREEVEQADTFRMRALEWAYALMPYMEVEADDLSATADVAEEYIGRNG